MHSYRRDLSLLKDRRFALLLSARTIAVLGGSFAPVALAFSVLELPGANAGSLSIVLAAQAIPMVAFLLLGGVVADRLPRLRVMMFGEGLNAVAYLAIAAMLISGWTPLPAIAVAAAVTGIAVAIYFPALTGIIPQVVPAEHLQAANGLLSLGANAARIIGFVSGGAVFALVGGGPSLITCGLLGLAALALIFALGRVADIAAVPQKQESVLSDLREGWRIFISKQWLWVVVAQFSLLVMALQAAHGVLGPVLAKQELGGAGAWSLVLAGEAFGMVVGVVIAMRLRPRRPILVATLALIPMVAPYVLLGLSAPLWTVIAGAVVMGICFDIFTVLWTTTMQREVPAESLSRVSSYDALGSLMLGPIGLLLAGPLAAATGPKPALLGCAALIVLVTLAALLAPGVRNLTAPTASSGPAPIREPAEAVT